MPRRGRLILSFFVTVVAPVLLALLLSTAGAFGQGPPTSARRPIPPDRRYTADIRIHIEMPNGRAGFQTAGTPLEPADKGLPPWRRPVGPTPSARTSRARCPPT